jgi:hypothetical protein
VDELLDNHMAASDVDGSATLLDDMGDFEDLTRRVNEELGRAIITPDAVLKQMLKHQATSLREQALEEELEKLREEVQKWDLWEDERRFDWEESKRTGKVFPKLILESLPRVEGHMIQGEGTKPVPTGETVEGRFVYCESVEDDGGV